jgi:hypothetical protein
MLSSLDQNLIPRVAGVNIGAKQDSFGGYKAVTEMLEAEGERSGEGQTPDGQIGPASLNDGVGSGWPIVDGHDDRGDVNDQAGKQTHYSKENIPCQVCFLFL